MMTISETTPTTPIHHQLTTSRYYTAAIIIVSAVAMAATLPGRTVGLGMITERLLADESLGLTRTGYGQINLWATLLGAAFSFGCGFLIDRIGLRIVTSATLLLLGLSTLLMCIAKSPEMLFVGVLLTRGIGQSALSVVSISLVGRWMPNRTQTGMAIMTVVMTILYMIIFPVSGFFATTNWRSFWAVIGVSVAVLSIPAWLIVRNLVLVTVDEETMNSIRERMDGYRWWEAMRTMTFWGLSGSICLFSLTTSGLSLFNESILVQQGLTTKAYYESIAIAAMVGLAGNLAAGVLSSWLTAPRLNAIAMFLLAGGLGYLTVISTYQEMILFAAVYGFAVGLLMVVFFSSWASLYGQRDLGKINGLAQMLTVFASAFGPLVFAYSHDLMGSYRPLLWGLAALSLAMAGWSMVTKLPPAKPASR